MLIPKTSDHFEKNYNKKQNSIIINSFTEKKNSAFSDTLEIQKKLDKETPEPSHIYTKNDLIPTINGAPYSDLADENGLITYNGITFICNNGNKQICLGDMSKDNSVLNIPLSEGGTLRVNRDNIGDLSKAISMFSAEDQGRIMRAIAQDTKIQKIKNEIEENENKTFSKITENASDNSNEKTKF